MALRICSIGCGRHARNAHGTSYARYVRQYPDTELVSCCDLDEQKARAFAGDFGFARSDTDLDVMLNRERPDAVCLISPPALTCELGCRVLRHGIPLLVEKPPGVSPGQLEQLIEAAGDTPVMVAFNRRFAPALVKLKSRLADLHIHEIDYQMVRSMRKEPDFFTTAIHGIDALRFLVGDFASASMTYQRIASATSAANMVIDGFTKSGTRVRFRCYPCAGGIFERATVQADGHTLEANVPMWNSHDMPGVVRHFAGDQCIAEISGEMDVPEIVISGFYGENEAFFEAVRYGRTLTPTLAESRQSVRVADVLFRRAAALEEV